MGDYPWQKLGTTQFQQLVNELMTSMLGAAYVPGDPGGGPDGGFDGDISGRIPFLEPGSPSGRWLVQAKHYKSRPGEACGSLKRDLVGPPKRGKPCLVDQARAADAPLILLLTSAKLQPLHVRKLRDAVSEHGLQLEVVAREQLRSMLDKRRWLRKQFFGERVTPALIPPASVSFAPLPAVAQLPFVGRAEERSALARAVEEHPVSLVVGAGGSGKSRFLQEVTTSAQAGHGFEVLWLEDEGRAAVEELAGLEFEDPKRRILVVVDDAHERWEERAWPLLAWSRRDEDSRRLVLALRESWRDDVRHWCHRGGADVSQAIIELGALPEAEVAGLLVEASEGRIAASWAERFARACQGNLLIAAHAVYQAKAGVGLLDAEPSSRDFRQTVVDAFLDEATSRLGRLERHAAIRVVELVCACGPVQEGFIEGFATSVGQALDVSTGSLKDYLARLTKRRLLLAHAGLRAASDVLAEFLLERGLDDHPHELLSDLARVAPGSDIVDARLAQLALVGNEQATEFCRQRLRSAATELERANDPYDGWSVLRRAGIEGLLPRVAPEEALFLLERQADLLRKREAEEAAAGRQQRPHWHPGGPGNVSHALLKVTSSPHLTRSLLERAVLLAQRLTGKADFTEWMNPFSVPRSAQMSLLDWAEERLQHAELTDVDRGAALSILTGALQPTRQSFQREGTNLHHLEQAVPVTDVTWRAEAMLFELTVHPDPSVRGSLLKKLYATEHAGSYAQNAPLHPRITDLRARMLSRFAETIAEEKNLSVLVAVHYSAMWYWLSRPARADDDWTSPTYAAAEQILRAIPRSLEFRTASWLAAPDKAIDDVEELFVRAPKHERWKWWVRVARTREPDDGQWRGFAATIEELLGEVSDAAALEALVRRLADHGVLPNRGSNLLYLLAYHKKELVDELVRPPLRRAALPDLYRDMLLESWVALNPDALDVLAAERDEPASLRPDVALELLSATWTRTRGPHPETAIPVLDALARHPSPEVRRSLIEGLGSWSVPDAAERVRLTAASVACSLDRNIAHALRTRLERRSQQWFEGADLAPIRHAVVTATEQAGYDEFLHVDDVGWLYHWALDGELSRLLEHLDRRLAVGNEHLGYGFYDGGIWTHALGSESGVRQVLEWARDRARKGTLTPYAAKNLRASIGTNARHHALAVAEAALDAGEADIAELIELLSGMRSGDAPALWLRLLRQLEGSQDWQAVSNAFTESVGRIWSYQWRDEDDPPEYAHRRNQLQEWLEGPHARSPAVRMLLHETLRRVTESMQRVKE